MGRSGYVQGQQVQPAIDRIQLAGRLRCAPLSLPLGPSRTKDANGSSGANSPDVSRPLDLHETENHDVISLHRGFPCVSVFA